MKVGGRDIAVEPKALILLRARPTGRAALLEAAEGFATALLAQRNSADTFINVMARLARDPFAVASHSPGYDVTVELRADIESESFVRILEGAGERFPVASEAVVLIGSDFLFRPCAPEATRFQYLMRRRHDLSHEAFADHYREVHSQFGFKTMGVNGYAQFHIDPQSSAEAMHALNLDETPFDGASQLYMPTLTKFLLATPLNAARGMLKDEKRFVDRENSTMFVSKVVVSLGNRG
jgi:hypothetical protein